MYDFRSLCKTGPNQYNPRSKPLLVALHDWWFSLIFIQDFQDFMEFSRHLLVKFSNENNRTVYKRRSKLTTKILEPHYWRRSGVFLFLHCFSVPLFHSFHFWLWTNAGWEYNMKSHSINRNSHQQISIKII